MPPVALNLRRPGRDIEQWHVSQPAYRPFIEFGEQSYPGLMHPATLSMTVTGDSARCLMHAFQGGKEIQVSLPGYLESAGFVTGVKDFKEPIDGLRSGTFEVKLTKAPWKNHMAEAQEWGTTRPGRVFGVDLAGPGADYTGLRITGLPKPPAGTIAQRIYGKSFTQTIIDQIAKATGIEAKILMADAKARVPVDTGLLRSLEHDFIYGHPNCRCTPVGITSKEKRMKVRNRFYLAAPHCTSTDEQAQDNLPGKVAFSEPLLSPGTSGDTSYGGRQSGRHTRGKWTRKNLADAIKHAEQVLDAQPDRDHVAIVRIVRVVRRKKAPVVVEVIK